MSSRPLSAAAMDREEAGDVDAAALRKQRAESLHRRKLGQSARSTELPKKSGYLLKKGPLKVTPHIPCAGRDMSAHGARRHTGLSGYVWFYALLLRFGKNVGSCWNKESCRTSDRTNR